MSRPAGPGARWLKFGGRPAAAGERTMIAQAPAASAGFTGAALYGVSCTGKAQCTATGLVTTKSGANYRTLAERWNGTKWAVQATPTPLSGGRLGGTLAAGLDCTSAKACMAAGYSYPKTKFSLLGEGWNGTKWTTQPLNKQPTVVLPSGISCTWAKDCMTVGERGSGATLAEHWNGKKWSVLATRKYGVLFGVTCPASRNCTAVGDAGDSAGTTNATLAEHWDGTSWTVETTPSPATFSSLFSVSCTSATHCVAAGADSATATGSVHTLIEVWNGSTWTQQTAPN